MCHELARSLLFGNGPELPRAESGPLLAPSRSCGIFSTSPSAAASAINGSRGCAAAASTSLGGGDRVPGDVRPANGDAAAAEGAAPLSPRSLSPLLDAASVFLGSNLFGRRAFSRTPLPACSHFHLCKKCKTHVQYRKGLDLLP